MTHTPAPSGYHHDPDRDTSCTWPHLTDDQRQVIGLLGYDAGHGRVPRLTVAEMATVDDVVRWAENRLNRPRSVSGMQGDAGGGSVAVQDDSAGAWVVVEECDHVWSSLTDDDPEECLLCGALWTRG